MKKLLVIALVLAVASGVYAAKGTFSLPLNPIPADSSSAPDAYGYTWVDNDNGGSPDYNWVDISQIGVEVEGLMDDNAVGPFNIGFNFPFYWYEVDHFYIGSNGYISFSSDANYSQDFPMIPSVQQPNDLVVPLAGDLDFTAPGGDPHCYYYSNNLDTLVVAWVNVPEWPYTPGVRPHTFELILNKADSSITYQYGVQGGTFANPDGASQIGIEDLVGRTGLRYMYNWAPPDRIPHDQLVIRVHASPDPNFIFHDVGVAGGMNPSSGALFHPVDQPLTVGAYVKNFGTETESNIRLNCIIKRNFVNIYNDTVTISQLDAGEMVWAQLPDIVPGDTLSQALYSLIFRTILTGDQFFTNNLDTVEMRTYPNTNFTFGYVDTCYSGTSWQGGGGGFANEFVIPDAIDVNFISEFLFTNGANPVYYFIIPADANGNPDMGNILFADTTYFPADTGWVNVPVSGVVIPGNQKFFVAFLSGGENLAFGFDATSPLSNRGWENTGSYAPSRDRALQDQAIKVAADIVVGIDDPGKQLPVSYNLRQNYPNPFNASTGITFDLARPGDVVLEVYNIAGQKVTTLVDGHFTAGTHSVTWNGSGDNGKSVTSGVYFYRLLVGSNSQTRKMVLLK